MRRKNFKKQKGAISLFVMIAMIFFLVTIISIYIISSKRGQAQTESLGILQEKYANETENNQYKEADPSDSIPIYTKEQLWAVGNEKAIEIEGIVYQFSQDAKYELQNDIVINIDEIAMHGIEISNAVDKKEFDIYYYDNITKDYYVPTSDTSYDLSKNGMNFKYANLSKDLGYVTDGLVLHYDGIKNTATGHKADAVTWKDLSGNGNDGTLISGVWEDKDLLCDGIDDYIDTGIKQSSFGQKITFEIVAKFTECTNYRGLYGFHAGEPIWEGLYGQYTRDGIYFGVYTENNGECHVKVDTSKLLNKNTNIVVTMEGSNKTQVYLNGVLEDVANMNSNIRFRDSYNFMIAKTLELNDRYFKGTISSFKVYKDILDEKQIQQNYEIDKARFGIE